MRRGIILLLTVFLSVLLFSCATDMGVSRHAYSATQRLLRDGNTSEAVSAVRGQVDEYNDKVLYYMDLGLVELYNGDYEAAADDLNTADDAIDEYGVQSVSENLGALLKNDYLIAYPGEKYEEILVDTFAAIAYEMSGDSESAMVEVRQAEITLNDFKANAEDQQSQFEKLVLAITPDPFKYFKVEEVEDFTGSAFVDYVSMIMYRGNGDISNAEVDYRRIQKKLTDNTVVTSDEIEIPSGMARVNLISLEGLIGSKKGFSAMATTPNLVTGEKINHIVAWPWFESDTTSVVSVTLKCSNGQSVTAKPIEDFSLLAKETLAMTVRSKYLKSFYRGFTKMSSTKLAADTTYKASMQAAEKAYNAAASNGPFAAAAATVALKVAREAATKTYNEALDVVNRTEIADTRMGQFFPARASVAGLTLEPGVYDFEIVYRLHSGEEITETYSSITVENGKTNLLLGTCAR